MDDDRPGPDAGATTTRPFTSGRRGRRALAALAGIVTVVGLAGSGALLVRAAAADPTPPIGGGVRDVYRLHRPYRGLPPLTIPVPVSGHRVRASLIDVADGDPRAAVLQVDVDGRTRSCRLQEGASEQMGGVTVELVTVHPKDRAEEASADVRISAAG